MNPNIRDPKVRAAVQAFIRLVQAGSPAWDKGRKLAGTPARGRIEPIAAEARTAIAAAGLQNLSNAEMVALARQIHPNLLPNNYR